jgi:hypothetical protein
MALIHKNVIAQENPLDDAQEEYMTFRGQLLPDKIAKEVEDIECIS